MVLNPDFDSDQELKATFELANLDQNEANGDFLHAASSRTNGLEPATPLPAQDEEVRFTDVGHGLIVGEYLKTRQKSNYVAAFDLDGTLIDTITGRHTPQDYTHEWKFFVDPQIISLAFQRLQEAGYLIVIMSNQSLIRRKKSGQERDVKQKLQEFCKSLNVPMKIFLACEYDKYRKPQIGMWEFMRKTYFGEENSMRLKKCFYVGNAAGRTSSYTNIGESDLSDSDRKFAMNIGVKFYTPEEYFLGYYPLPYTLSGYDPTWLANVPQEMSFFLETVFDSGCQREIVLFVGPPCSGRSFLADMFTKFRPHLRALVKTPRARKNPSITGSQLPNGSTTLHEDIEIPDAELSLELSGVDLIRNVVNKNYTAVVDDPEMWTREQRANVVALARELRVPIRCICISIDTNLAIHLDAYRAAISGDATFYRTSAKARIKYFYSQFEKPDEYLEGFDAVIMANFVPMFDEKNLKYATMRLT